VVGSYGITGEPRSRAASPTALQRRLLSSSTSSRTQYWRVAWHEFEAHPLLGSGADTFELYWSRNRPLAVETRFAHSLYLETLAEVGPVGLLALTLVLAIPILALRRARHHPLAAAFAAVYAATIAHAAIDWDWQLPGVFLPGLIGGAAVVLAARPRGDVLMSPALRAAALVVVAGLASFAAVTWFGNRTLDLATSSLTKTDYAKAALQAKEAARWQPWASEPWRQLGIAQIALHRPAAARHSFRIAVAKDPLDWQPWFDLALVAEGREQTFAYNRARRLNPLAEEFHGRSPR